MINVPVVSTPPSGNFFPSGTAIVTNVATSLETLNNQAANVFRFLGRG
jgi:hypothetical protein